VRSQSIFARSAEANECAIKAARKYASDKYGSTRNVIVSLVNSFHGRTITTLAATGQDEFHNSFLPLTGGFIHTPANDIDALYSLVESNPDIAAFMIEAVQGEGGIMPLEQSFVDAMAEIAAARDILIICDEVQCGNGRTGKLYAYMNYGITPDIVSTAKGLGGGLPLGATLFGEKTENVLTAGTHGSTFGGNPVSCAGALSILPRIDDALLEGVKARSAYIVKELSGAPGIKSITGLGLMLGVETEKPAADVIAACMEKGVLVIKAKNKVRLLPALNIPMDLLAEAVSIFKEVCAG
jgi:acetylornithine/N-succinyldiaminopimelate aminotransferase